MNQVFEISLLIGLVAQITFFAFCLIYWIRGITGAALLLVSVANLGWVAALFLQLPSTTSLILESISLWTWSLLLLRILGFRIGFTQSAGLRPLTTSFVISSGMVLVTIGSKWLPILEFNDSMVGMIDHLPLTVISVSGLVLIEQLARNTLSESRWRVRYMIIGLGMMFAFSLVNHAIAVLLGHPLLIMSVLQPGVAALVVPFMIITSLHNRTTKLHFNLSRAFVFRTSVLLFAGLFLFLLGIFGYLAQIFAGDIGLTLAVFVSLLLVALTLVIVSSSRVRSLVRVQLTKAFFEYRYDYRDQWINVTAQLSQPSVDFDLAQQAQRLILNVLSAKKACIWIFEQNEQSRPLSTMNAPHWQTPLPRTLVSAITSFYRSSDWIVDFNDAPNQAADIRDIVLSSPLMNDAGYMVPLFAENQLFGVCITGRSELTARLVWEDHDMIKLIARQCAAFLALETVNKHLLESEQLSAVNQMSAFLMHDIKTITGQLSLMLENAPKNKHNPAFIDDMLSTTQNSVKRMERILTGLRKPTEQDMPQLSDASDTVHRQFDLTAYFARRESDASVKQTTIRYTLPDQSVWIAASEENLGSAIFHLVNNALEAVDGTETGLVEIVLEYSAQLATISIKDNGPGMDAAFIQNELFVPFRSTKGITGMGIGAYQARDLIRSAGGDLQVTSTIGVGTAFIIRLPMAIDNS